MGYNTSYHLDYEVVDLDIKEGEEALENFEIFSLMEDSTEWYGPLDNAIHDDMDDCKWYEHEKDLLAASKAHPNMLLTLEGIGEEHGDHWKKYFLNGKMHYAEAQTKFEPFDITKLR